MSLFPFTDDILSLLGSPEAAAMASAFGIRAELPQMEAALRDVLLSKLEPIKKAVGGSEYLLDSAFCGDDGWNGFPEAVGDAEVLLDELSTELALRRELGGVREMLARKISIFFSRRNPLAYSRRLSSRIKQINERLAYFARKRLDSDGEAWKQQASFVAALEDGPRRAFHVLPLRLKHCFAYCLLFPVNYAIDMSTIIQIWIAQGLVPASNADNKCMEEFGHEYFMDLCRSSLFTEIQEDQVGNIVTFKVHNIMYSFAKEFEDWVYSPLKPHPGSYHLSSVQYRYDLNLLPGSADRSLFNPDYRRRTFLMPDQPRLVNLIDDREWIYDMSIRNSPLVRVLDLHHACIKNVPSSIDKLKHLRYLDLSYNIRIETLPRCITTLWNLQTLKLSYCKRLKELPDAITKLLNLRHLEIDGCCGLVDMPCGIGQLKHLHILSMFVVSERGEESVPSKKAGLSELEGLHRLRGGLKLRGLENARGATTEVKAANMKDKQCLETLTLEWETIEAIDDDDAVQCSREDEATLECLEPNLNLKGLCIHGYGGVKFPNWLYSPIHLVKVTLNSCYQCQYLPPLDQLFALKHLMLEKLSALEYIIGNEPSSSFRRPRQATYFPSLEQLCLGELPNLKGWFEEDMIRDWEHAMYQWEPLPTSFSVLSVVTVDDCPKLSMPLLPSVRSLHVNKTDKIQLQSFLQLSLPWLSLSHPEKYGASFPSSSSNVPHPNLKSLCISYVRDLDHLPETYFSKLPSLEDFEIRHCPSLVALPVLKSVKSLTILSCQRLTSLSGWINHLIALEDLKLHRCPELDLTHYHSNSKTEDTDLRWWPEFELSMSLDTREPDLDSSSSSDGSALWDTLKRLTSLEIMDIPKLVFLPEGLRAATSLQRLELSACIGLEELPEWISEFHSLQELVLSFCPNLKLLPKGLANLEHLSKLKIIGCPLLKQRYNKETGASWKDIAHVGDVEVR